MEKRPVILVVMDGIGIREDNKNNAVALANKPTLDKLWAECPHTQLRAHGLAVGLPTDSDKIGRASCRERVCMRV